MKNRLISASLWKIFLKVVRFIICQKIQFNISWVCLAFLLSHYARIKTPPVTTIFFLLAVLTLCN